MKISCEIECTPEEARRFLGLMDVAPVNAAITEELVKRASEMASAMNSEEVAARWVKQSAEGLGDMQRQFFEKFMAEWDRKD